MSAPYAPPPGPPPPSVPEGWKAQYDDRYQSWYVLYLIYLGINQIKLEKLRWSSLSRFYVDLATGKSQWEKPEPSASPAGNAPSDPPPSYDKVTPSDSTPIANADEKKRPLASNNPYNPTTSSRETANSAIDSDAQLAAKLQAEEDALAGSSSNSRGPGAPGSAGDYYSESSRPQSTGPYASGPSSSSPMPEQKSRSKGFLSKLMGKSSSSSRPPPQPRPQYALYPQQPPPNAGYYDPNYGRYPQQPMPGYGYPPSGYGGYPPQGGYYQQQPQRKQGLGTGGAAALGVGGGLLGGLLLADAVGDIGDHNDYDNGNYDGGGGDFDGGGDFGGGDF